MDSCVCGQVIGPSAIYFAFPLSEDNEYAYVNEWHEHCLAEWGWRRSYDPENWLGIEHVAGYCGPDDEDSEPAVLLGVA